MAQHFKEYKDAKTAGLGAVKKTNIYMDPSDLELKYQHIRELDDFEIENRCRQIIKDLVQPIIDTMDTDRTLNAKINMKQG